MRFGAGRRWNLYLRGMEPEEGVLIKWYVSGFVLAEMMAGLTCTVLFSYDSRNDRETTVFAPHTAFEDPSAPDGVPMRESIELRLLVLYDCGNVDNFG